MSADWKARIRKETGLHYIDAITLLAKRKHSQKGVAEILGIGHSTLLRNCRHLNIPWAKGYETIEFREAMASRGSTPRIRQHMARVHRTQTERALHTVEGVSGTIEQLAAHFGKASARTARRRIKEGMSVADAVLTPAQPMFGKTP